MPRQVTSSTLACYGRNVPDSSPVLSDTRPKVWRRPRLLVFLVVAVLLVGAAAGLLHLLRAQDAPTETVFDAAPEGDLVFSDDFEGNQLDQRNWLTYEGPNRWGTFDPDNVIVEDGKLILRTKRISEDTLSVAGISSSRFGAATFGEYQVRLRLDPAEGTRGAALLWPAVGRTPPEIVFFEVPNATRENNNVVVHYGSREDHQQAKQSYQADFTQWQVVGVRWTPEAVEFTLNGQIMGRIDDPGVIPRQDMWLAIQHHLRDQGGPPDTDTPSIVDMEVDWVKVWR